MQLGRALMLGAWGVVICVGRVHAAPDAAEPPAPADQPEPGWAGGDHLTGEWGGARSKLADQGVTIDVVYASDVYTARGDMTALGHIDAAVTLDTHKLGLWDGGTFYVLGQNNHGSGPNEEIGSAVGVSNLEAQSYTQLTELFLEQALFGHLLR